MSRRTVLILGVANHRSIAWACVQSFLERQYRVVFTYQNQRFAKTSQDLILNSGYESQLLSAVPCDVQNNELPILFQDRLPELLGDTTLKLDAIVHSIAYAPSDAMKGGSLMTTSREAFLQAHEISAYSFLQTAQCALPLLIPGISSLTTLSYLGAVRAVPNYNVMGPAKASLEALVRGIALELPQYRINAVSAGPIPTLASRGISNFSTLLHQAPQQAPLQRNVTVQEVANTVRYVATEATGMTAQTIYIDAGFHTAVGGISSTISSS
jgi:enoyl-[acyl-carrier protein] reductase I